TPVVTLHGNALLVEDLAKQGLYLLRCGFHFRPDKQKPVMRHPVPDRPTTPCNETNRKSAVSLIICFCWSFQA
ncbi:hypothetical protein, partial [Methylobacter sp.]